MNSTANSNFNGGYNENAEPGFCAVCATGVISNGSVTLTILWILAKKNSNGIDTNFVLNLLIADWLQSVGFSMSLYWMAISDITPGLYCDIQGVIMSIGGMGSVSWVTLITIYTFLVVVYSKQPKKYSKIHILSTLIIWIISILLSVTYLLIQKPGKPFFTTVGGNSTFCWIDDAYNDSSVYIIYMSILLSSIIIDIILHGVMFYFIYRYSTRVMFRKTAGKLILYSMCYVVLTLPLCSYLLFGHFGIPAPYSLLVVCSCIFSLNGLTDSIIYGCLTYIASLKPVFEHHSKDHKKKYRYDDDNDLANMNNDIEENSGTKNQSEEDFCEVIGEIEEIANDGSV